MFSNNVSFSACRRQSSRQQATIFDDQISQNARRIGLDVQMDNLTIGDGNCWYRAVVQKENIIEPSQRERFSKCWNHVKFMTHITI